MKWSVCVLLLVAFTLFAAGFAYLTSDKTTCELNSAQYYHYVITPSPQSSVGPPWFSIPQLVIPPGQSTTVNVTYVGDNGHGIRTSDLYALSNFFMTPTSLGPFNNHLDEVQGYTGLTVMSSPFIYRGNASAYQILTVQVARDAPPATYESTLLACANDGHFLVTVGWVPYTQDAPGLQPVTLATTPLWAGVALFVILFAARFGRTVGSWGRLALRSGEVLFFVSVGAAFFGTITPVFGSAYWVGLILEILAMFSCYLIARETSRSPFNIGTSVRSSLPSDTGFNFGRALTAGGLLLGWIAFYYLLVLVLAFIMMGA